MYDLYGTGSLIELDPSSGEIENRWNLALRTTISHVYVNDEDIFLSVRDADGSYVLQCLENEEIDTLTSFITEGRDEEYMGIFQGDEEQVLHLGVVHQRPVSHTFVRQIDTKDNDESKYDRVDLEICLFEAELTSWELESIVLDTIELYIMNYDGEIEVCNTSNVTIDHADLWIDIDPRYTGRLNVSESIVPGDSYSFPTEFGFYGEIRDGITLLATGANYKFNGSEASVFVNTMVATEDQSTVSATVNIYPNPSSDIITIASINELQSIALYNTRGEELYTSDQIQRGTFDISLLVSGIYFIKVQDKEGRRAVKKLIKR